MNVLIADDHPLFREALRGLLKQLDDGIVVTEAACFEEILSLASDEGQDQNLDLLLLDLRMPGPDWPLAIKELRARLPSVPIVVVSASERAEDAHLAIRCGALGYILKDSNPRIILNALRLVLSGGTYVPPLALELAASGPGDDPRANGQAVSLTPRQREVLGLMGQGKSNKEIARDLGVAVATVKLHASAIFAALGVGNRTEAVVTAAGMGLAAPADKA